MSIHLHKTSFAQWLQQKRGTGEPVGFRGQPEHCPLANWLNERHGTPEGHQENFYVEVDECTGLLSDGTIIEQALPRWAQIFAHALDAGLGRGYESAVTADTCLSILRECAS